MDFVSRLPHDLRRSRNAGQSDPGVSKSALTDQRKDPPTQRMREARDSGPLVADGVAAQPDVVIRNKTGRPSRQAACARADALVRETFDHLCQVTTCGEWHRA